MTYKEIVDESQAAALFEQSGKDEISGYLFKGISFSEIPLKSTVVVECKFEACSLANADLLNASFRSVEFESCNSVGVNWAKLKRVGEVAFKGCKLDYSCFQGLVMKSSPFIDCSLREADFSEADLSKCDSSRSVLIGSTFTRANLEKADLRSAKGYFIDPRHTKIKGAKFSFPDAITLLEALGAEVEI